MTNPTVGLQPDDLQRVMDQFGVGEEQVRRDHAISPILLAALSRSHREQLIFFGDTALSRTFLLDGRLSEDIDLIALINRDELAEILVRDIANALRQTHGRIV
jgi:predicted nucleotidyltransferase component of viral defense system